MVLHRQGFVLLLLGKVGGVEGAVEGGVVQPQQFHYTECFLRPL